MSKLFPLRAELRLLMLPAALLALSGAWVWARRADLVRLRHVSGVINLTGAAYEASVRERPAPVASVWPGPAAQSSGPGWIYEVFTPPVVYYHPLAKSFALTPSVHPASGGGAFGLELLGVKLEPYRLQLVGYFGGLDDYLAAFVSPGRPETLLARRGDRFEALGLTLRSLEVKKIVVAHTDAWPVYDVAALAVVRDEQTGAEVVLDSRERKFTDTPLAVLKVSGTNTAPRTVREGDLFTDEAATYRVEHVQLAPPEVVVARQIPGRLLPETMILRPAGTLSQAGNPPPPAQTGLAANDS